MVILRSICIAHINSSLLFLSNTALFVYNHSLIHLPVNIHLGCFHFGGLPQIKLLCIFADKFVWTYVFFLLGKNQGKWSYVRYMLNFFKFPNCFSKGLYHSIFPSVYESPRCPQILANTCFGQSF